MEFYSERWKLIDPTYFSEIRLTKRGNLKNQIFGISRLTWTGFKKFNSALRQFLYCPPQNLDTEIFLLSADTCVDIDYEIANSYKIYLKIYYQLLQPVIIFTSNGGKYCNWHILRLGIAEDKFSFFLHLLTSSQFVHFIFINY